MNVCVLGGSGFVGTELVGHLVRAGHWVRVPTRNIAHAERLRVLDTAELRVANVHEPRVLSQLFADCEAVVNLVGILNPRGSATFESVHTALAAKVMAAARTAGVRRVLHMSALGAHAQAPSRYLRSKAAAEEAVRAVPHPELPNPAVTIFRPSVIFGAGDSLTNRFAGLLRLSAGLLPLARAGTRFAPISVLDVAEAFVRALRRRARQVRQRAFHDKERGDYATSPTIWMATPTRWKPCQGVLLPPKVPSRPSQRQLGFHRKCAGSRRP